MNRRLSSRRGRGAAGPADPAISGAIADAIAAQERAKTQRVPHSDRATLELEKWRLIHRYVRDNAFVTDDGPPRSAQWRQAVDYARDLKEIEVLDWVLQQIEIAEHDETGVRDLRPRGSGPCHRLLLRYVANRERKAGLVLNWALAAAADK